MTPNADEIRRLSEKATAGQWSADGPIVCGNDTDTDVQGFTVAECKYSGHGRLSQNISREERPANADLIVYLRNHALALADALDENERLTQQRDMLLGACKGTFRLPRPWMSGKPISWPEWDATFAEIEAAINNASAPLRTLTEKEHHG